MGVRGDFLLWPLQANGKICNQIGVDFTLAWNPSVAKGGSWVHEGEKNRKLVGYCPGYDGQGIVPELTPC